MEQEALFRYSEGEGCCSGFGSHDVDTLEARGRALRMSMEI